jgi:tetratricopeptide (TPR) repeat protein
MSRSNHQHGLRIAQNMAGAILRMWPAETREWGRAFEAEFSAIETGGAAFSWLIGGLMLLLREWWKHFWRSFGGPIGANSEQSSGAFTKRYSRVPQTPLWLMLLLLLSGTALLLHPEVRQALGSLRSEYAHTEQEPARWSSVKKLRTISASRRDPQLLALLSLLSEDDEERLRLSEEAIEKDPSLTWLDYEQSLLPANDLSRQKYLPASRLTRLQKWDSLNAVPHLLAAEIISKPARAEAFDAVMRGGHLAWEDKLAQNSQWLSEMSAGFSAPKYDSYMAQTIALIQDARSKFSVRDPDIALFVLKRKRITQFDVLRGYVNILMERGAAREKAGDASEAIATYSQVLQFSQRMLLGHELPAEQYFAQGTGEKACEKLQKLYGSAGRNNEAALVSFQLAEWKAERDPKLMRNIPLHYHQAQWNSLAWSGLLINLAGLALLLLVPVALLSFLFVFWRRKVTLERRGRIDFWASLSADDAPWLLLASSAVVYFTYHPYARVCDTFLNGSPFSPDIETFVGAALVPHAITDRIQLIPDPYSLWLGATALLCLIGVLLLWRMTIRHKPAT